MVDTDFVVIDDTDQDVAPELSLSPRRFYLHDEMFPIERAESKTKRRAGAPEPQTWEWIVPNFSVNEVAKTFFGLGPDWLRWRYHPSRSDRHPQGYFVLDGKLLEPKRTPHNIRYYTLPDIERMAHALTENGTLDGEQLVAVIQVLRGIARIYGVES